MSRTAHDLLYRRRRLSLSEDCGVGFLAPEISLVLDALSGGQQGGIYGGGADRGADLAHGFADRVEEGVAGVLHQMPAVSDLGRRAGAPWRQQGRNRRRGRGRPRRSAAAPRARPVQ